jgi:hypothetical protein
VGENPLDVRKGESELVCDRFPPFAVVADTLVGHSVSVDEEAGE